MLLRNLQGGETATHVELNPCRARQPSWWRTWTCTCWTPAVTKSGTFLLFPRVEMWWMRLLIGLCLFLRVSQVHHWALWTCPGEAVGHRQLWAVLLHTQRFPRLHQWQVSPLVPRRGYDCVIRCYMSHHITELGVSLARYPTNKWQKLGTFHARDERTVQSFPLDEHLYAKYVKVSWSGLNFPPLHLFYIELVSVLCWNSPETSFFFFFFCSIML